MGTPPNKTTYNIAKLTNDASKRAIACSLINKRMGLLQQKNPGLLPWVLAFNMLYLSLIGLPGLPLFYYKGYCQCQQTRHRAGLMTAPPGH